jgi:hypothetical protein
MAALAGSDHHLTGAHNLTGLRADGRDDPVEICRREIGIAELVPGKVHRRLGGIELSRGGAQTQW